MIESPTLRAILLAAVALVLLIPLARARAQAVPKIGAEDLARRIEVREPLLLVDVREPNELTEDGMIAGSINVPLARALEVPSEITAPLADRPETGVIVICRSGARATRAASALLKSGVKRVAVLEGGILAWKRMSFPIVTPR